MCLIFLLVEAGATCSLWRPADSSRPVGLAFDSQGRMFVSSDASGEVYVVVRDQTTATPAGTSTGPAPASTTSPSTAGSAGPASASTTSPSTAGRLTVPYVGALALTCALVLAFFVI